jgi:hypothetical protein
MYVEILKLVENCTKFRDMKYGYRFWKYVYVFSKVFEANEEHI